MDERVEELYKAVLGDEGKHLGEMRQEASSRQKRSSKKRSGPISTALTTNGLSNASGTPLERAWCASHAQKATCRTISARS
jgi:hypothetical protein